LIASGLSLIDLADQSLPRVACQIKTKLGKKKGIFLPDKSTPKPLSSSEANPPSRIKGYLNDIWKKKKDIR
jgi:hypothetical protein